MRARPISEETVLGLTTVMVILALAGLTWMGFTELSGYAGSIHNSTTHENLVPRR